MIQYAGFRQNLRETPSFLARFPADFESPNSFKAAVSKRGDEPGQNQVTTWHLGAKSEKK